MSPSPWRGRIKEGGTLQISQNHFLHSINVFENFIVPESENDKALPPQPRISCAIGVVCVLSSVDFDHEAFSRQTKSTIYDPRGC
jgi:hypothetical protein